MSVTNGIPVMVKCTGAAHSNPHIDNCIVCMPYWSEYPTCPEDGCGKKLRNMRTTERFGRVANCSQHGRFKL